MTIAIYAGSFDPITNGHLAIISRGCMLFDELVVLVAVNPDKDCLFSLEERLGFINEALREMHGPPERSIRSIRAASTEGLVVDYAREVGAKVLLRGLRSDGDLAYEAELRQENLALAPEIETVLMLPDPRYQRVSSSIVKLRASHPQLSLGNLVPPGVARVLRARHGLKVRADDLA